MRELFEIAAGEFVVCACDGRLSVYDAWTCERVSEVVAEGCDVAAAEHLASILRGVQEVEM